MGEEGQNTYLLGPLVELASDLDLRDRWDQQIGVLPSFHRFHLMMEAESSFPNVDGQSPKRAI
jgi:hypothetical protein